MPRTLTAADRSALIRLASTLPAGDETRRAILAGLKTSTNRYGWDYSDSEWAEKARESAKLLGAHSVKEYLVKAQRAKSTHGLPSDGSRGQYDAWHKALSDVLRDLGFPE